MALITIAHTPSGDCSEHMLKCFWLQSIKIVDEKAYLGIREISTWEES